MPIVGMPTPSVTVAATVAGMHSRTSANAPAASKLDFRTVAQADATRPNVPRAGGYRKVLQLGNEGGSWYHALQVKADRTVGSFVLVSSYTLARARDTANFQLPEDSRNIAAELARADNDVRHNVTAGVTWQLPSLGPAFAGWTVSATGQFRTNRPYTIAWGDDRNGTAQRDARPGARKDQLVRARPGRRQHQAPPVRPPHVGARQHLRSRGQRLRVEPEGKAEWTVPRRQDAADRLVEFRKAPRRIEPQGRAPHPAQAPEDVAQGDRKSTRLNSSHRT